MIIEAPKFKYVEARSLQWSTKEEELTIIKKRTLGLSRLIWGNRRKGIVMICSMEKKINGNNNEEEVIFLNYF